MDNSQGRVLIRLVLAVALVTGTAGVATAQATRAGGSVVVAEGETVGDLQAAGGSVVIRGTVDGDVRGYAGTVVVEESGVVTGDLQASAGSVIVRGTVRGDVEGAAGSVVVGPGTVVGGDLTVAAAEFVREEGATVGGRVVAVDNLSVDAGLGALTERGGPIGLLLGAYLVAATLLDGAVLLVAFPGFTDAVVTEVTEETLRSGGIGLGRVV